MYRYIPFAVIVVAAGLALAAAVLWGPLWLLPLAVLLPLVALGVWDMRQSRHTLRRLYPVAAHMRWFFEWLRPFLREYLFDSDHEGRPFSHNQRALVYRRAKGVESAGAFGTEMDLHSPRYEWINHSVQARHPAGGLRVPVGGPDCSCPYDASVLNVSAMSFGSLSARAVEAMNLGAREGGFYQDTGEGGISPYHLEHGGDLVWEIGTGYFGCRTATGGFDPEAFAKKAASDRVKMIEVKLSQGAKPGHGGLLPGAKVTPEIAEVRGVPVGEDVLSPPAHTEFDTPHGLLEFVERLRALSGGKPVGVKLCIGHRWEFLALCKAMLASGRAPDFFVIDGAEGGTGAAPAELSDHVGTPLREALVFAVNALIGTGLREKVRVAASGKVYDGHTLAANLALGADWCNAGRAFMFSAGCVQTKKCHTDRCPTGVATQDPMRQKGLVVSDKAPRVARFHRATVDALMQYVGAAGLDAPAELRPHHLRIRTDENEVRAADEVYEFLAPRALLETPQETGLARWWAMAQAESFAPRPV